MVVRLVIMRMVPIALAVLAGCSSPPVQPRFPDVRCRLILLDASPAVGTPLRIRLDLVNEGDAAVLYDSQQCDCNESFEVLGPDGRQARFIDGPRSTFGSFQELPSRSSVTLIKETDLTRQYLVSAPGRYTIRFRGFIRIVDAARHSRLKKDVEKDDRVDYFRMLELIESSVDEPSNTVIVEVRPGAVPEQGAVAEKLLAALPKGWDFAVNWIPPRTDDAEYTLFGPARKKSDPVILFRLSKGPALERETKVGDVAGKSLYVDSSAEIDKIWPDHRRRLLEILNGR